MENVVRQMASVEPKIKKLIERHQEIKERQNQLQKEIIELREINDQQKKIINELKEKNKLLKIAKSTETIEGAADAKLKINEMIREIDKCIGLLNK